MNDDRLPLSSGSQREELDRQQALVLAWLQTDDALQASRRLLARRSLDLSPGDLIHEAWIRVRRSFEQRTTPLPDLPSTIEAARYGARVLDNLTRDHARRQRRSGEVTVNPSDLDLRDPESSSDHIEDRVLVEQLLLEVSEAITEMPGCPGCDDTVVAAGALTLLHLVLGGHDGSSRGRTWIDRMLHEALDRVDPSGDLSDAARNQRKSRCGRCVIELITAGMARAHGVPA